MTGQINDGNLWGSGLGATSMALVCEHTNQYKCCAAAVYSALCTDHAIKTLGQGATEEKTKPKAKKRCSTSLDLNSLDPTLIQVQCMLHVFEHYVLIVKLKWLFINICATPTFAGAV